MTQQRTVSLTALAEQYRLRITRDECGDPIIRGKNGHLYTDGRKLMLCWTDDGRKRPFSSAHLKRSMVRRLADMATVVLDCEYEAILHITDLSGPAIRLVLKLVGVKRRRQLSPESYARQIEMLKATQFQGKPTTRITSGETARKTIGGE